MLQLVVGKSGARKKRLLAVRNDQWVIDVHVQWHPAITKCHGTEKNVRYSGFFVYIAKTPL